MENHNSLIKVSWLDLEDILNTVSQDIMPRRPDIILAIQRGGSVPAVMLSHLLGIRSVIAISCVRTVSEEVFSEKAPPLIDFNEQLQLVNGKKVLIVDDIIGSGLTIKKVYEKILEYSPSSVEILSCYVNLDNWELHNKDNPDSIITYVGKKVRGWVIFPWEQSNTIA